MIKHHCLVAGVDVGGTKTAVAIGTADGRMLARYQTQTPQEPEQGVDWITDMIRSWQKKEGNGQRISGLGMGCPGPLDRSKGIILQAPNLGSWNGYPLGDMLTQRLDMAVELENDANLAAMGEHRFGAGVGCRDLVYVTVSTGIGGGLIMHNELVRGVDDSAGEIGHMMIDPQGPACNCGSRGCLEAMASGTAIVHAALEKIRSGEASAKMESLYREQHSLTAKDVASLAAHGDEVASSLIEEAMIKLGVGIGNIISMVSPQVVVLGGGVTNIGERIFKTVREQVRKQVKLVPVEKIAIVPAKLGGDSVLYGGFYLAAGISQNMS